MPRLHRTAAVLFLLSALSGCADQRDPIAGIPDGAADGLYPQMVIAGAAAAITVCG
jgi:hypothetical protein